MASIECPTVRVGLVKWCSKSRVTASAGCRVKAQVLARRAFGCHRISRLGAPLRSFLERPESASLTSWRGLQFGHFGVSRKGKWRDPTPHLLPWTLNKSKHFQSQHSEPYLPSEDLQLSLRSPSLLLPVGKQGAQLGVFPYEPVLCCSKPAVSLLLLQGSVLAHVPSELPNRIRFQRYRTAGAPLVESGRQGFGVLLLPLVHLGMPTQKIPRIAEPRQPPSKKLNVCGLRGKPTKGKCKETSQPGLAMQCNASAQAEGSLPGLFRRGLWDMRAPRTPNRRR